MSGYWKLGVAITGAWPQQQRFQHLTSEGDWAAGVMGGPEGCSHKKLSL